MIYLVIAEDHFHYLEAIFQLFSDRRIFISLKKSFLAYLSVKLLSFKVDSLGLLNTAYLLAAFKDLEFPKTLKALETYLGATRFLHHLLPYYTQISKPLQRRKVALLAQGR